MEEEARARPKAPKASAKLPQRERAASRTSLTRRSRFLKRMKSPALSASHQKVARTTEIKERLSRSLVR